MRNSPDTRFTLVLIWSVFGMGIIGGCASSGPSGESSLEGGVAPAASYLEAPKQSPSLTQLLATLKTQGYDGVGLEFESDSTLEFLNRVFQSPRAANRKLKLMYTGLALSYDPKHESLTVGGTIDAETVLKYIDKYVPVRPPPSATPDALPAPAN